jgi:hypothetical protein
VRDHHTRRDVVGIKRLAVVEDSWIAGLVYSRTIPRSGGGLSLMVLGVSCGFAANSAYFPPVRAKKN